MGMTSAQEGAIAAFVSTGDLERAKTLFGREIFEQYFQKWSHNALDIHGSGNKLFELRGKTLRGTPTSESKASKPDDYTLKGGIHGIKEGDILPLSDKTYYVVKKDDLLLMARCVRNGEFANANWEVIPLISQLVIDLVCCNSAILSSKRRKEVARMLRAKQDLALKNGQNIADIEDPPEYSRSMLRKFDPNSQNTLLYALVQSGKSPEQIRLILIAWFVLGVQPIMHVQSASGRLVHGPQFIEGFETFVAHEKSKQKDHLVTLGTLLDRYDRKSVRRFVGLDLNLKTKRFRDTYFKPTIGYGGKALESSKTGYNLHVPLLLANLANGQLLLRKTERDEEKLYLDSILKKYSKTYDNLEKAPVMFIFDEDDKQKGSDLSEIQSDPEDATKYEQFSVWIKSYHKKYCKPKEKNREDYAGEDSSSDSGDSESDDGTSSFQGIGETEAESEIVSFQEEEFSLISFRQSVQYVVSVTATPIGTLLSSHKYQILKQEKAPYNYFGLGNNDFSSSELESICAHPNAVDIRCFDDALEPLHKQMERNHETQSPFSEFLPKAAKKIAEVVVPHMVANPNGVLNGHRNCLLFESRIGKIQQILVHLTSHLAANMERSSPTIPAIFALEFHGKSYSSGMENIVAIRKTPIGREGVSPNDARAPLRLWINEAFFQRHRKQIEDATIKICHKSGCSSSFLADTFKLSKENVKVWLMADKMGAKSDVLASVSQAPLRAIQFNKGRDVPELKHGFSLLKAVWKCALSDGTVCLGFTGSTPATDGRGVVNKDTEHEIQLTDQVLPSSGIDLTSLMQSLRISGCVKDPLEGKPKLWVSSTGLKRVKLALQITEEFMSLKEELQKLDGDKEVQRSIVDFLSQECDASLIKSKYPGIHSLDQKIKLVPSIRGKRVVKEALEEYSTNHQTPEGCNHIVFKAFSCMLQSRKTKTRDKVREIFQEQFVTTIETVSSQEAISIVKDLKSIFDEGGNGDAATKTCLEIVRDMYKRLKDGETIKDIAKPPPKSPRLSKKKKSTETTSSDEKMVCEKKSEKKRTLERTRVSKKKTILERTRVSEKSPSSLTASPTFSSTFRAKRSNTKERNIEKTKKQKHK